MKHISCLLLAALLCFNPSIGLAGAKPKAIEITDGYNKGISAKLIEIDGKPARRFFRKPEIKPGTHVFGLSLSYKKKGFFAPFAVAHPRVTATVKVGRKYIIKANFKDESFFVWIADANTGQRVSEIIRTGYWPCYYGPYQDCGIGP